MDPNYDTVQKIHELLQKVFEHQEQIERRLLLIENEIPKIEKKEEDIHSEVSKLRTDLTFRAILKL